MFPKSSQRCPSLRPSCQFEKTGGLAKKMEQSVKYTTGQN